MRDITISHPGKAVKQYFLLKPNIYLIFQIFMFGSVAGFVIEGIWSAVKYGYWEHHLATIWGPFCIIYCAGAVLVYALAYILRNRNVLLQITTYMLAGSLVEYFFSLFQEIFFGSVSWDYSDHFLNIGGRVSLKMTLIWGVLCFLSVKLIFPCLMFLVLKFNTKPANAVTWALIIFMAVNLFATCLTVNRWRARQNDIPPGSKAEQIIDSMYSDAKMERLFPNMCFIKENQRMLALKKDFQN